MQPLESFSFNVVEQGERRILGKCSWWTLREPVVHAAHTNTNCSVATYTYRLAGRHDARFYLQHRTSVPILVFVIVAFTSLHGFTHITFASSLSLRMYTYVCKILSTSGSGCRQLVTAHIWNRTHINDAYNKTNDLQHGREELPQCTSSYVVI